MAIALKILGQLYPTANVATNLYTVPASTSCVVGSIVLANQGIVTDNITVSIRQAGASFNSKQIVLSLVSILPKETKSFGLGISLATTDEIWVTSLFGTTSINAFGQEIT